MDSWEPTYGMNFFDTMDYLASNWMLPIGGLLVSIYAGWVLPKRVIEAELSDVSSGLIMAWTWLVRFVAPILVLVVLMQKVGIIEVT
jgi:NSS family neurotransmitter:Na+ symporter